MIKQKEKIKLFFGEDDNIRLRLNTTAAPNSL